jgi:DNA-binding MarR family transcriptional regulator
MFRVRIIRFRLMLNSTSAPATDPTAPLAAAEGARADLRVLAAVRRIVRAVQAYSRQLERSHGLSVTQLVCLANLRNNGPMTLKGLAERLRMAPSSLVSVVDRLVEGGLASRERDQQDRRKLVLTLSAKGETLLQDSPALLDDLLAHRLNQLPEDQRQLMASALEHLVDLLPIDGQATQALPLGFDP